MQLAASTTTSKPVPVRHHGVMPSFARSWVSATWKWLRWNFCSLGFLAGCWSVWTHPVHVRRQHRHPYLSHHCVFFLFLRCDACVGARPVSVRCVNKQNRRLVVVPMWHVCLFVYVFAFQRILKCAPLCLTRHIPPCANADGRLCDFAVAVLLQVLNRVPSLWSLVGNYSSITDVRDAPSSPHPLCMHAAITSALRATR
jgi:hypothetical protein